jgi:anti-sigma regulatory factor (Ser/Thr protein kinase)
MMIEPPSPVVKRWPRTQRAVGRARRDLAAVLTRWDLAALTEPAALVLSELMANSVRHARVPGREIETRYERVPLGLRLEVHDASPVRPALGKPAEGDEGGRGLVIVDALTRGQWGVTTRAGVGKAVWALITSDPTEDPL